MSEKMSNKIFIIFFILMISSCSYNRLFEKKEVEPSRIENSSVDSFTEFIQTKDDSLNNELLLKNNEIDSLYAVIEEMNFSLDSLFQALEISNSRVLVNTDFQIPDSIIFAGRKFDLRNERLFHKFEEIFNLEVQSAHKFIPRSGKYFAIFDSIFSSKKIPLDIKYLAIAESRLSSMATSRVGAAGIWQFMKGTAKGYGLKIDSFVDERRDVFKSTDAAARLLKNNYDHLSKLGANDWLLAMSAYNAGAGSISRVIKEQGGTDFFELIMKADETHRFVWRSVAIKMIFENEEEIFGEKFERQKPLLELVRKEKIKLKGHYKIDDWANAQGTAVGKIWEFNPWIKIFQRTRKKYSAVNDVVLPPGEFTILVPKDGKKDLNELAAIERKFLVKNAGYFTHHTVKKGDTLYDIARKYKTTVSKIKSLNNLKSNIIRPRQKLKLYGSPKNSSKGYYVVKKGDTLSGIARKCNTSVAKIKSKNGLKSNTIYPGQKLFY